MGSKSSPTNMPGPLDPAQRRFVASTWALRASGERAAALRFERLARTLAAADAPADMVALALRAGDDERRHVGLCDELAALFGWTRPPLPPGPHHPIGPTGRSPDDRLLYELVSACCLSETLNACMLRAILDRVRAPQVRDTVQTILSDEVHHARLGWRTLQHAREQGRGDFLGPMLPRMLRGAGVSLIDSPDAPGRDEAQLAAWGELDHDARLAVFHAAMRDVVWPGLESAGVHTDLARAWCAEHVPAAKAPAPRGP